MGKPPFVIMAGSKMLFAAFKSSLHYPSQILHNDLQLVNIENHIFVHNGKNRHDYFYLKAWKEWDLILEFTFCKLDSMCILC